MLANITKYMTKKYIDIAKAWLPTAGIFGATGVVGLLYITDWRVIVDYVPIYNTKFKSEEDK